MFNKKFHLVALGILAVMLLLNQWQILLLKGSLGERSGAKSVLAKTQSAPQSKAVSQADTSAIAKKVLPSGVPPLYGQKLGVSFDDPASAINVLSPHEQDTRPKKLEGENLKRYVAIGFRTSCEYCCGAKTLVFQDGAKACGCAHSAAMRGVIAYLLENFGGELSDDEILSEANKWKAAFFPGPTVSKYAASSAGSGSSLPSQVGGC